MGLISGIFAWKNSRATALVCLGSLSCWKRQTHPNVCWISGKCFWRVSTQKDPVIIISWKQKRLVFPVARNSPQTKIFVRFFGTGQIGRAPLSLRWVRAHSTRFLLWILADKRWCDCNQIIFITQITQMSWDSSIGYFKVIFRQLGCYLSRREIWIESQILANGQHLKRNPHPILSSFFDNLLKRNGRIMLNLLTYFIYLSFLRLS